ncbi:MAG: hypothetical protein Q7O12_03815 [Deltaproteobacteria bacterium]|nr:hypothetical protein [Deltaproteobacteria bacterium]
MPTTCTVAPAAPALAPGEGADRPTNVLTSMAVVDSGSLILTGGRQAQVDLHLLLPLS